MSVSYSRVKLLDGISYTSIIDKKFKTNNISIKFMTKLEEKTASDNAAAIGIIGSSNKNYKTISDITTKLNALYGTSIGVNVSKRGDVQVLSMRISTIDNLYAFDGEDISGDALDILMDCLFNPNAQNGEFGKEIFDFRKKDLLDSIEAEINNKRGYAILRAQKQAFHGELAASSSYGDKETAQKITMSSSFEAYKNILRTSIVEIYYVGSKENESIKNRFKESFKAIERNPQTLKFSSPSMVKPEVREFTDTLEVNQTKMVLAFKTNSEDIYAIKLFSTILGETPFSKLFANVREKYSLCYYCASAYNEAKNTLFIDSGVEKDNIKKAHDEIINQITDIQNGNFTDNDINNSVLSIFNAYKGVGDTPSSYINWYFSRMCRGEADITPEKEAEMIKAVTKERVIEAAKSFKLDTFYVMSGEEK